MIVLYNAILIGVIFLFFPLWIAMVGGREKHRTSFFKRLYMPPLKEKNDRASSTDCIWIHALSVGEVLSAEPLVRALKKKYGRDRLVFTASTVTGYALAERVLASHVKGLRFFPYDLLFSVQRAIRVIRPCRVIIVETDIWPNFLHRMKRQRVPVFLVNARLSQHSFSGYKRISFLMAPLLSVFQRICVQTETDRHRFLELGVDGEKLVRAGNMKFDQDPVSSSVDERNRFLRRYRLPTDLPIWIAGSTHPGEEKMAIRACQYLTQRGIASILVVAPRDPARALDISRAFTAAGIPSQTLQQMEKAPVPVSAVIIDRIGMLRKLYVWSDVAFVGGSLVNAGGHNPLEPASAAKPILFGPHTEDFDWICKTLVHRQGAIRVNDASELGENVSHFLLHKDRSQRFGQRAYDVFRMHRGAVDRTLAVIHENDP